MTENKKMQGNVMKVVSLGLQDRVYSEMKKPTFSIEKLARTLSEEGTNITSQSIRKFIHKTKKAQQELIAKDLQTANQVKQLTIDYTKELHSILDEVKEVKNTAKDEKDMATYNQLIGRLMQGIELLAKLTGDIKPKGSVDINIIYQEINQEVQQDMKKLRKEMFSGKVIDIDFEIKKSDEEIAEELTKSMHE